MTQAITALDDSEDDDFGWNLEGSGLCSVILFGNALQVWGEAQGRAVLVDEAALAFNVRPELIHHAIDRHAWMFVNGAGEIESDGE